MPTLYRGKHFVVHHHRATGYVHFVRTEEAFASNVDVVNAVRDCELVLSEVNRSESGILLDWRRSRMSTDVNLHAAVVKHCDALAAPFRRRAVLLATSVGRMQAQRIIRTHSDIYHEIFSDMDAAIAYVTGK